jgi:hypothetical protein
MDATQAPSVTQRGQIHAWIVNHDESKLFLVLYLTLALVLSVAIGLFWLVALVVVHFAFEHVRSRYDGLTGRAALGRALWNVKLDVALVLFALVLALYLQVVMGVLGLHAVSRAGALAQAGARGGIRFAAWEKVIRGILLSADDADRQPQAGAAAGLRGLGLLELLEDALLVLGGDARPGIDYRDFDPAVGGGAIRRAGQPRDDATLVRVLDRVGEQVEHDLADARGIGIDHDATGGLDAQLDPLLARLQLDRGGGVVQQRRQVGRLRVDLDLPASIFEMSRMSLISSSRWRALRETFSTALACFSVSSP